LPLSFAYDIIASTMAKGRDAMKVSSEALWKIFEQTGSIAVYIFYRKINFQ
jgi:hypothetical protein